MLPCYHSTTYFWKPILFINKNFTLMCCFLFKTSLFALLLGLTTAVLLKILHVILCSWQFVGYLGCEMFGMWEIPDVWCLGFGIFRMRNVWDNRCWDVGSSRCTMFSIWDVRDVDCSRHGIFGMWHIGLQNAAS